MQEEEPIMVVWCELKIPSLRMPNSYLVTEFSIHTSQPLKVLIIWVYRVIPDLSVQILRIIIHVVIKLFFHFVTLLMFELCFCPHWDRMVNGLYLITLTFNCHSRVGFEDHSDQM